MNKLTTSCCYIVMMVIFDLDDTLYKEADYVESGCKAVAEDVGRRCGTVATADSHVMNTSAENPKFSADYLLNIIHSKDSVAKGFDALVDIVGSEYPAARLTVPDILKVYRTHIPDIHLDKSVEDVLRLFAERGIKMGMITDGRIQTQRLKIHALGLDKYIPEQNILISEATGADKHFSLPFDIMMRRNPGESRFVYVGDNPEKDFLWPNRLGWLTVMLLDTDGRNIHPQRIPADSRCYIKGSTDNLCEPTLRISHLSALPQLLHNGDYVK